MIITGQVAVTSEAQQVVTDSGPPDNEGGPRSVIINNTGNTTVFLGPTGVTVDTGFELPVGGGMSQDFVAPGDLYVIAASTGSVSYLYERNG